MAKSLVSATRAALTLLLLTTLIAGLSGCSREPTELSIFAARYGDTHMEALQDIFKQQSAVRITPVSLTSDVGEFEALTEGLVELALVENSTPFQSGMRAILPMHESVLHLLVRDGVDISHAEQPLMNKIIYVGEHSLAGQAFIKLVAKRQRLQETDYKLITNLDGQEPDVVVHFGPISPAQPSWFRPGYKLFSLRQDNEGRAMSSQAISYMMPQMHSKVIPARTYDLPGNEVAIYTVAVDAILATNKAVPEGVIYELTRTLLEQKPRFATIAPEVFAGIRGDFNPLELNFPLHSGARRYLARDEPSMLERYAESINLVVYLVFLVLTGMVALTRWHAHRKKDRIDKFYTRIFAIRMRAMQEPPEPLLAELQQLELEAFESLIKEKLAADDSFRIFIELLTRAMDEVRKQPAETAKVGPVS
ncbi:TAXI family TRAP transporter solute-binding subunit [Candidatus Litorirhabdus singularis]|uniref:TAXI family TRAP transporter solute-binding subunit n=1 Tax=Candidatus Litorirhabdus singularis TaxID=2518993 RepID=UPI00242C18EC|nr:TAXI family TRAP transporter solute-binding subunit [Candidatus Litorirhabdus singularis]